MELLVSAQTPVVILRITDQSLSSCFPCQLSLFDLVQELPVEKPQKEITYTRSKAEKEKKQPSRAELPAHLVHKIEVIEPGNISEGAKKIGEIITEMPEYESVNIYMRQIVRLKYAALICLNSPI